ncbi:unnamed protein product [Sphenostylis stenocarpa]|uniref:Uncharacterized protein n=1 Tax=Sphenostylis stenocarpa TaxID=92480 RepID=A0AA86VSD3_9FABA|nr:unnamed protein product [Sphenostylis stenocarpa]
MASNNKTSRDPIVSSAHTLIPPIPRRRKHRNPGIAVAFRLSKKHSGGNNTSPVNFWEGLQKNEISARKLAAEWWQWLFMSGDVFPCAPSSMPSSKYQAYITCLDSCMGFTAASSNSSELTHSSSFDLIGTLELIKTRSCDLIHGKDWVIVVSSQMSLANGNLKTICPHSHISGEKLKERKDQQMKSITILRSRNGLRRELESSMQCLKCSKEEATKWNPALKNEEFDKFTMIHGMKNNDDKKIEDDRYFGITNFLEFLRAQRTINELKATQKSSKKIVKELLQNLEDEKVFQKCRECKKIESVLDDLKDKLSREKKSRERMELFNAKLVHELAKTKLSSKQYMTNYRKEKKERKMIEEVCNELAMQVREDTAKLERLLSDSVKICKEVEEEREMMEMAELWREERVQMKLADAQFLLEDKYNLMVQLIDFLQEFLRSRGAEIDTTELEDAQLIKQVVESVSIKRIVELSYDFSKSDVTFSTFEELINKDNTEEGMTKPGSYTTFTSPLSNRHTESLDEEVLNKSPKHHTSPSSEYNIGLQLTNSLEAIGYIEDQKFSSMAQRGDIYSVHLNQDKNILGSEAECSQKACLESLKAGVNGVCSASVGSLKRKAFVTTKQLRSCLNGGKTISSSKCSQHKRVGDGWHKQKECNHSLPISPTQNAATTSQCQGSFEGSFQHSELLEQGNSAYSNMNPHILRGMRGCTEWPRGIPKSNFNVTSSGSTEKPKSRSTKVRCPLSITSKLGEQ